MQSQYLLLAEQYHAIFKKCYDHDIYVVKL